MNQFTERDNIGTRYDTHEQVQNFWAPYVFGRPKFPFIFYDMRTKKDAMDAMLALPPIKIASDSGKLICTEVLQFGVYSVDGGRGISWGFFLAGDQITPSLFELAIENCKKYNGTNQRLSDPPQGPAIGASAPPQQSAAAVAFDWEEKVDMLKHMKARGMTIAGSESLPPQIATKRHYKAPNKDAAISFLKANPVDKPFYYLVIHTPDGTFGRDKDGIFEQPD